MMGHVFISLTLTFPLLLGRVAVAQVEDSPVSYNAEIRPILARCLPCHGPDGNAREAGLALHTRDDATASRRRGAAVVPGDPDSSSLMARVISTDPDLRMPPPGHGKPLSADEVATLKAWISEGADYEKHWAWVAPESRVPTAGAEWARRDLDRFVAADLEARGLVPSPPADRYTLARRLSLDLLGIPPSPEMADAFVVDERPDATERYVDRLLESPAFGERWARVWLDIARYADTKGYEQDGNRTIWPWRDWVIDAYNSDMPFDRFTIEQLAGDLLPNADEGSILATAFHRNTMTNDEGGTRDEEFRVAAVVDRVNTTMEAWMGLSAGCAQCHAHKYDPISHEEYYGLYAIFNTTQDADRNDESPVLDVLGPANRGKLEEASAFRAELVARLDAIAKDHLDATDPSPREGRAVIPLLDDVLPPGATPQRSGGPPNIPWRTFGTEGIPEPKSGVRVRESSATANQVVQHYFDNAPVGSAIELQAGDRLVAWIWIDPAMVPSEIVLQWHAERGLWEHRAFWGEDGIPWGTAGGPSKHSMGEIPPAGGWVRLDMDPADLDLLPGDRLTGVACTQRGGPQGGRIFWDGVGVETDQPNRNAWPHDFSAWLETLETVDGRGLPEKLAVAVSAGKARTSEQRDALQRHWSIAVRPDGVRAASDTLVLIESADARIAEARAGSMRVPVLREQAEAEQRVTKLLERGDWRSPGSEVQPGVPEFLPQLASSEPPDRLDFARWLCDPDNPLTARVQVNRAWERFFGRGLVETQEDFGTQGSPPANQAMLDHLARRFIELDWSWKALCREIATSATYAQQSNISEDMLRNDPANERLDRGSRFRLDAEAIRDSALVASGLMNSRIHGPPVFPPQPDGVWQVTYNNSSWQAAEDENRYRRGLYTFWRRTSPYPAMMSFDAASRETCVSRRIRTNTPLQALVTLNDEAFVEAAGGLAIRAHAEAGGNARQEIARSFRLALVRPPRAEELDILVGLLDRETVRYQARPEDAGALIEGARVELPEGLAPAELAARIVVANVILNLDEFLVRG